MKKCNVFLKGLMSGGIGRSDAASGNGRFDQLLGPAKVFEAKHTAGFSWRIRARPELGIYGLASVGKVFTHCQIRTVAKESTSKQRRR
jgi:hypothetical protein